MNISTCATLAAFGALVLASCSQHSGASEPAPTPAPLDKPGAPVEVDAVLHSGSATVTVVFRSAGSGVSIAASGVDGLQVQIKGSLASGNSYPQGAKASFEVPFLAGSGLTHLVVSVRGQFHGATLARVSSFAVGTETHEQMKTPGEVTIGDDGVPVKGMDVNAK